MEDVLAFKSTFAVGPRGGGTLSGAIKEDWAGGGFERGETVRSFSGLNRQFGCIERVEEGE